MEYSTAHLAWESLAVDPGLFNAPSRLDTALPNRTGFRRLTATTAAGSGAAHALLRGASVHIATATFRIVAVPGQTPSTSRAVDRIEARFLNNINNGQFVTGGLAHVYDFDGQNSAGTAALYLAPAPVPLGMRALSERPYVVTRPDGSQSAAGITARVVHTGYNSPDTVVAVPDSCALGASVPGNVLATIQSCSEVWPAAPGVAVPMEEAEVDVAHTVGDVSMSFPVRIRAYAPTSVRLHVDRQSLRPGEMARYRVLVRWGGHPAGPSQEVEVGFQDHCAVL